MDWKSKFYEMAFPFDSKNESMTSAYMLKQQNLPAAIYKYRAADDYSKQNLMDGKIWLADPSSFNDPYDCAHTIDMSRMVGQGYNIPHDALERLPPSIDRADLIASVAASRNPISTLVDKLLHAIPEEKRSIMTIELQAAVESVFENFVTESGDKVKSLFKICSFSERMDSLLMWAHYANNHKGFCIEYDVRPLGPDNWTSRFLYPVIYTDLLFDVTEHVDRGVEHPSFNNLYWNLAGLHKAKDWAYENEWRLVFANGILPVAQSWPMPKPAMVYLGSHISSVDEKEILLICKSIDVPAKKMKISRKKFKMIAVEID
jgi:hypothetical protein